MQRPPAHRNYTAVERRARPTAAWAAVVVALAFLALPVRGESQPPADSDEQPAAQVLSLPDAIGELSDAVIALGEPGTGYALSWSEADRLLNGYVARVAEAHMTHCGQAVRRLERIPAGLNPAPEELPRCLLQALRLKGDDVLVHWRAEVQEAERFLTATLYRVDSGEQQANPRLPFLLPEELEALVAGESSRMSSEDADWFEVFGEMFPAEMRQEGEADARVQLAEADYLLEHGLWAEAADRFLGLEDSAPNRLLMKGVFALVLAGKGGQASAVLQAAQEQHFESGPLYALAGWVSLREGRPEDAPIWLEQARGGDMTREGLYRYARALIALEQGDEEIALEQLQRAAELLPDKPFVHLKLARLHRDKGELDQAVAHYRQAAAAGPPTAATWSELGVVLDAAGQTTEAIEALRHAFRLRTDRAGITQHLASLLKRTGRHEEALDVLRRAAAANPCRPDLVAAYGDGAAEMWRLDEARQAYTESAAVGHGFAYAEVRLAAMMALEHRYREAQVRLMDLLARRPDYQPARIELGRVLAQLGHVDEALSLLAEASRSPEHEVSAHLATVDVALAGKRLGEAVRSAQIAAFSRPGGGTYAALSAVFLASGDVDKAESAALTAVEKDPFSARAHLALARVRHQQQRDEQARTALARALELDPYSVEALEFNGVAWQAAGELHKCAESWRRALALNPWHAELHRRLADVLGEQLGDWPGALEHYRKYAELEEMRTQASR